MSQFDALIEPEEKKKSKPKKKGRAAKKSRCHSPTGAGNGRRKTTRKK